MGAYEDAQVRPKRLTLLGTAEQSAVVLEAEVDVDELGTGQKLHDHARGDNGGDTKLHEGTPVGRKNSAKPVKRVRRVGRHDTVERDL